MSEQFEDQDAEVVARVDRDTIKAEIDRQSVIGRNVLRSANANGIQVGEDAGPIVAPSAELLQTELVAERNNRAASGFSHVEEVARANLPEEAVLEEPAFGPTGAEIAAEEEATEEEPTAEVTAPVIALPAEIPEPVELGWFHRLINWLMWWRS